MFLKIWSVYEVWRILKNIDRVSIIKNLGLTNTYNYFHVLFQGDIPSIFLGKIKFENK